MREIFTITNIEAKDLLRWNTSGFYNVLEDEYRKQFNIEVEIEDCEMSFIENGLLIELKDYRQVA